MRTITGLEELKAAEGETLGTSDWHEVTQKDVNTFADVTGDHQWIHVDVERAKETPFKGTIAHGYLTLSLGPYLNNQVFKLEGFTFALNYGLNKVRFPAPVPIPSKVRVAPKVKEVTDISGGATAPRPVAMAARAPVGVLRGAVIGGSSGVVQVRRGGAWVDVSAVRIAHGRYRWAATAHGVYRLVVGGAAGPAVRI